jgi:hypothetical protein
MNMMYNHTVQTLMLPETTDPFAAACAASMHFPALTTCLTHVFYTSTGQHNLPTARHFHFAELFNFNLGYKLKAITVLVMMLASLRSYLNCKRQTLQLPYVQ